MNLNTQLISLVDGLVDIASLRTYQKKTKGIVDPHNGAEGILIGRQGLIERQLIDLTADIAYYGSAKLSMIPYAMAANLVRKDPEKLAMSRGNRICFLSDGAIYYIPDSPKWHIDIMPAGHPLESFADDILDILSGQSTRPTEYTGPHGMPKSESGKALNDVQFSLEITDKVILQMCEYRDSLIAQISIDALTGGLPSAYEKWPKEALTEVIGRVWTITTGLILRAGILPPRAKLESVAIEGKLLTGWTNPKEEPASKRVLV